nr:outer membrane beta-barrel protein [Vibrio furnissii]
MLSLRHFMDDAIVITQNTIYLEETMHFNPWFASAIAMLSISSAAIAQTEDTPRTKEKSNGTIYVGAGLGVYNNAEIEYGSLSTNETGDFGDFGYNLLAGYEFNTHKVVKLGVELEYRHFGEVNFADQLDVEGDAFFINVRPKFIVSYDHADLYVALIAGLGTIDLDATATQYGVSASKSEAAFQYGAEFGVLLNEHVDLHVGYRAAQVDVEDFDVTLSTGYAGIRYHF